MGEIKPLITLPVLSADDISDLRSKGPDYVIFDLTNERSVINMVPDSLKNVMLGLGDEWRYLSERELYAKCEPDPVDARLRLSFWDEYLRAQDHGEQMIVANVVRNITSMDYWENRVLRSEAKVAFLVIPPKDLIFAMKAHLDKGIERLGEFLDLPVKRIVRNKEGVVIRESVDSALIGQMVKIIQLLDNRVHGAVVQKNLNMNIHAGGGGQEIGGAPMSEEEIQKKIDSLRKQMKKDAIDAEVTSSGSSSK